MNGWNGCDNDFMINGIIKNSYQKPTYLPETSY